MSKQWDVSQKMVRDAKDIPDVAKVIEKKTKNSGGGRERVLPELRHTAGVCIQARDNILGKTAG